MNLERVIGSRAKISLLRFLAENKDWQFNLAEISKSVKIDKGALSRIIRELESLKIIEVKRNGKLLLLRLNQKNKFFQLITSLFEKEARL
jgi:DNA-binding MarR family transcriptional regulator